MLFRILKRWLKDWWYLYVAAAIGVIPWFLPDELGRKVAIYGLAICIFFVLIVLPIWFAYIKEKYNKGE